MSIAFPRVLKNMNVFVDGRGYAGRADEITLPTLALTLEDHRAGGMDLPVELELGMEKLELSATFSDFDPEIFKQFGLLGSSALPITVRGAFQAQGSNAVVPVICNMRGGWKSIDPGSWTPGSKSTLTLMSTLNYFKLTADGEELVEIDAINMVRRIGGVDQMAAQRNALGV